MGNVSRVFCVALPFALTVGALVAMLVAGLGLVTDKSMYMFQVNTTNLTISSSQVTDLLSSRGLDVRTPAETFHDPKLLQASTSSSSSSASVSAEDLGLYDVYNAGLWGYCYTAANGTTGCTKSAFNWATGVLNMTTGNINSLLTATGKNVTLPSDVTDAVSAFETVSRWTEIVFIIAYIALGVELLFGIFANCSRAFSCVTFLVALVAAVAVCAAAALGTATSVVVVGTLEGTAKAYGVTANFNTRFLVAVWVGAAFALGAGFFWLFTICCCAPDHRASRKSRRSRGVEDEKLMPTGAYAPIGHEYHGAGGYAPPTPLQYGYVSGANGSQREGAYEPYKHSNV